MIEERKKSAEALLYFASYYQHLAESQPLRQFLSVSRNHFLLPFNVKMNYYVQLCTKYIPRVPGKRPWVLKRTCVHRDFGPHGHLPRT